MTTSGPLSVVWSLLFMLIAFFYAFGLVSSRAWIHHGDAGSEVGHGMMAIGMTFMLTPLGVLNFHVIRWNIILFALASLWFIGRVLARKPLLAIVSRTTVGHYTVRADAIHVFMNVGMSYMFLLMSSMTFSMTLLAIYLNFTFLLSFAFLTVCSVRKVSADLQIAKMNWQKLGTDTAGALMSGVMSWMFIEIISMTIRMGA